MPGASTPGPIRECGGDALWTAALVPLDRPSVHPDFGNPGGFDPETTALWGIRLPWNQPGQPFYDDAGELLETLLARFEQIADAPDLEKILRHLLGPQCFAIGAVDGIGAEFVAGVPEMLQVVEMLLRAELYDATRRNPASITWQPGGIVRFLTAQTLYDHFGDLLREAAEERDALVGEIMAVCESPGDFFPSADAANLRKFKRFVGLGSDSTFESQYQSGRMFGELLFAVLQMIESKAAAPKAISRIPDLAALAESMAGESARFQIDMATGKPVRQ